MKDKHPARSTPLKFKDCAIVVDSRGKEWTYNEPGDVWKLITNDLGPGSVSHHSSRSYQRLLHEFGPLTTVSLGLMRL
jgi:hypothetical protein